MKKTLITIAFATASMFAAQTPAQTPPAAGTTPAPAATVKPKKVKKAKTHKVKKGAATTPAPASK